YPWPRCSVERFVQPGLAQRAALRRRTQIPRADTLGPEDDRDVVGGEVAADGLQGKAVRVDVLQVNTSVELARPLAPQDVGTADERDPTQVKAAARVVDHHRGARIALEVRHLPGGRTGGDQERVAVAEEPHRDEVDRAVAIEGGELRDQARREQ